MRLYGNAKMSMALNQGKENHYAPQTKKVQRQRKTEVIGKIGQFLKNAIEETHGRYHAWWMMKTFIEKDTLRQVEEDLYRGWNM